jgi:anti-sigma B factor antagonist
MAELIISERKFQETAILDLRGDLIYGGANTVLRNAIRNLLAEGKKQIILNMENVGYVDSSGVGELISGFTAVSRKGGSFKLLNLSKRVHDLLAICKLLTVFDVSENTFMAQTI